MHSTYFRISFAAKNDEKYQRSAILLILSVKTVDCREEFARDLNSIQEGVSCDQNFTREWLYSFPCGRIFDELNELVTIDRAVELGIF